MKTTNGTWCKSDNKKAEIFRAHLAELFQPHSVLENYTHTQNLENSFISPLPLYLAPKPFSPGEIQHLIKSFPLKKAPGIDLITAELARELSKKALIHLTYILNSILRLSYFPLQWKVSVIILIPKPGKPPDIA